MAKKVKLPPSNNEKKQEMNVSFDEVLTSLPKDIRKEVERQGINSFEDIIGFMLMNGIDPLKMMEFAEKEMSLGKDFKMEDVMLDDEFFEDDEDEYDNEEVDEDDVDFEDSNGFDDEAYLLGMTLPKQKFIGPSKREFHIRIKLNDAPVKIWRELVVPSNITLELLAYVLIDAMG